MTVLSRWIIKHSYAGEILLGVVRKQIIENNQYL